MLRFIALLLVYIMAATHADAGLKLHGSPVAVWSPSFATPWSAQSPWNSQPVNPVFGTVPIPTAGPFGTNNPQMGTSFSDEIYFAQVSDPPNTATCSITDELLTRTFTVPHWPAGAVPDTSPEHHMDIFDSPSSVDYAFYDLVNTGVGTWNCFQFETYPNAGSGWGSPSRPSGPRAAGISEGAGMLRTFEYGQSIVNHALIFGCDQSTLIPAAPQYPATNTDPIFNYTGNNFHMGALLMLPPNFNVNNLATPEARAMARTLMKYGGYIVDTSGTGGGGFSFYAEIGSNWFNAANGNPSPDLLAIRFALQEVVSQDGWLDANGNSFTPTPWQSMNFMSMRGPWSATGGNFGFFNTISANYEIPDTTVTPGTPFTVSTAHTFRDYTSSTNWQNWYTGENQLWYNPIPGKSYTINAFGTGTTATASLTVYEGNFGTVLYSSPSLSPGQSTTFTWPVDILGSFAMKLFVNKSVGAPAAIRLEITPATAQSFYVNSAGSDSNDGMTPATAWQTAAKVNSSTFNIGDTISFAGGQTFTDALIPPSSGYLSSPITFTSYGTGVATIAPSASNTSGCTILNKQFVTIANLKFTGQSSTTDLADGCHVENNQAGNTKLEGIVFNSVEISNFGYNGIHVTGTNGTSGFNRVVITKPNIHNVAGAATTKKAGILFDSPGSYGSGLTAPAHANPVVSGTLGNNDCLLTNNVGSAGQSAWTGSAVVFGETSFPTVEFCTASGNGTSSAAGTALGIWAFDSSNPTFQYNAVYGQNGAAISLDGGVTGGTAQYNYCNGSYGPCTLQNAYNDGTVTTWDSNVSRYNISQNDNTGSGTGSIAVQQQSGATMTNAYAYNNVIYTNLNSKNLVYVLGTMTGEIFNTIEYNSGTSNNFVFANANSAIHFVGSDYFGTFAVNWNGTSYSSLSTWGSATGQGGSSVTTDPQFISAGAGPTSGAYSKTNTAYQIHVGSPMINAGQTGIVITPFNYFPGFGDFYQNGLNYVFNVSGGPYPIGAYAGPGL